MNNYLLTTIMESVMIQILILAILMLVLVIGAIASVKFIKSLEKNDDQN